MNKLIHVAIQLTQADEFVSIPVSYTIIQENEIATIYSCKVDMPVEKIPKWLLDTEFSFRKVYKNGVTIMSKMHSSLHNVDTCLFVDEVMQHIRTRELVSKQL